ncbi:hypothetical protein K461DRAFT_319059 [Myriangium duriaei CBS 260.36]|uniref:Uncharacterized protein n=1 Tax=Myriangium duriaei CBS 260.36 TaxID=1168546 RepID=A0A9P4J4L3_9PEZI|nr:hypothetical protein K461DRAFT_319059 [Myriangium duriaei CBS 260.36]
MGGPAYSATAVSLAASQLGGGLLTLSAGALVAVSTYFLASTADTNQFGLTVTVSTTSAYNSGLGPLFLTYTNAASAVTEVGCTTQLTSVSSDVKTGSVLCPASNLDFGTGSATLSFRGASTSFAFYVGATTDVITETAVVTDDVPGQTAYLYTATDTTYETTVTSTSTVTLTGDLSTSYCPSTTTEQQTSTTVTTQSPETTTGPSITPAPMPHHQCTKGRVYNTLAHHPQFAGYLCKDLLAENHHTFPSSISVWPAATLSSACSCYETNVLDKREVPTAYGPLTPHPVTSTTSYDRTRTDIVSTDVVVSTSTKKVDGGTYTTTASTDTTLDLRTPPTTCVPSPTLLDKRTSQGHHPLELQTAYLYVEVLDPVYFCNYYMSAKRSRSPLLGLSALHLTETCTGVLKDADQHVPDYANDMVNFYSDASGCDPKYERAIKGFFRQSRAFCRYWGSKVDRGMTPIPGLSAAEIYSGCQCILPKD